MTNERAPKKQFPPPIIRATVFRSDFGLIRTHPADVAAFRSEFLDEFKLEKLLHVGLPAGAQHFIVVHNFSHQLNVCLGRRSLAVGGGV